MNHADSVKYEYMAENRNSHRLFHRMHDGRGSVTGLMTNGLAVLCRAGYKIPNTLAIQATNDLDEINCDEFRNRLAKKLVPFWKRGSYDLAIRSSCTLEDAFGDSMAGRFESFLGTMNFAEVLENIEKIIVGFQMQNNQDGKMGIVIQNRIHSEYSGIIFSSNPITYSKKQMMISYTKGMGDKLVSGKTSGKDVIVEVDKASFKIKDDMNVVLKERLLLLSENSKSLEKKVGYPVDIEWAIAENEIYYIQCRPLANITRICSGLLAVNRYDISGVPMQIVSHDKVKLRLEAQEGNICISDAYLYIKNSCFDDMPCLNLTKSKFCKGYSVVIIYPQHLSNKVVRSSVIK